jgi:RNA polymerase sigma-70 factor (ECF subfamily)
MTTKTTTTVPAEATTTSAPDPFLQPSRPGGHATPGAARARTEELYTQHSRVVLGLCHALLRNHAEAEDAAQQTFLSAHRALVNGSEPREGAAWLATIARNECWSRIRSGMRQPLPSADLDDEASASDPVAEAIRRADLAALWVAVSELPVQQREALLLREFAGLSYEELAEALAVTTPAVESLLFRARQGLRARLQTAYAAISGVGWVEWAARLVAGGSAPAAAKVAAVGMSAAVVTGGAVVTPRVLHRGPPQATTPAITSSSPLPVLPRAVLVSQALTSSTPPAVPARPAASGDDDHRSGDDDSKDDSTADAQEHDRENDHSGKTPAEHHGGDAHEAADDASSSASGDDDEPGDSGKSDSSDDSGDGSPDPASDRSGRGGGIATPVPNPPVTVTVPTVDDPPEPVPPGDD